tara:strand:+ start:1049 stop:1339 length:291 start_codon:yes stop_codon:yes gene_type:complete
VNPAAAVVPLVAASDKSLAAEIEAHIQQLGYDFVTFVSVYPQPHLKGELPKMDIFVGTDGSHRDRAVANVVLLALKQEHIHHTCALKVESRRGRVQ